MVRCSNSSESRKSARSQYSTGIFYGEYSVNCKRKYKRDLHEEKYSDILIYIPWSGISSRVAFSSYQHTTHVSEQCHLYIMPPENTENLPTSEIPEPLASVDTSTIVTPPVADTVDENPVMINPNTGLSGQKLRNFYMTNGFQ
jgi:hypothetical protein